MRFSRNQMIGAIILLGAVLLIVWLRFAVS